MKALQTRSFSSPLGGFLPDWKGHSLPPLVMLPHSPRRRAQQCSAASGAGAPRRWCLTQVGSVPGSISKAMLKQ